MKVLVTGVAGFIGMHCARRLLERGDEVIGVDNLSPYYSVELKKDRLKALGIAAHMLDIAERARVGDVEHVRGDPERLEACLLYTSPSPRD